MKRISFFLLPLLILFSCNTVQKPEPQQEETATVEFIRTVTLNVEGMHCTGCENTITKSVGELPGVKDVTASHTDGLTTVVFDTVQSDLPAIKAAIESKGYTVTGLMEMATDTLSNP
ncbi:MAG: cation transporter [Bacteroidetes bacterium]|nr:cation transporter [Bacteroidota bacterium]